MLENRCKVLDHHVDLISEVQISVGECFLHYSRMEGSDMMTMTYVLEVKTSMKAAKLEFLTSMLWKEAASLLEKHSKQQINEQIRVDVVWNEGIF